MTMGIIWLKSGSHHCGHEDEKNAEPAEQLEYAAQLLRQKSSSGSAKTYPTA